jgi:hypothetical protein
MQIPGPTILQLLTSRLGMGVRLKALARAMDRINAGETEVAIPYLHDPTELGRIAATVEALRCRLIEADDERRRMVEVNAAMRESEVHYRMLADNTGDIVLQYD